jgi:hypothetical protein
MYHGYRDKKLAGNAIVKTVGNQTRLVRTMYHRETGAPEPDREDVLSVNYLSDEYFRLLNELEDLKELAKDFASVEELTIAELRTQIQAATKGI